MDDGWRPVKRYIEETMKVPTDREQTYFEEWDEPALRQIIRQQRKITETSKQMKLRSLYQILIVIRRFRRQSAPAQALGRQRAGHAVCRAGGTSRSALW